MKYVIGCFSLLFLLSAFANLSAQELKAEQGVQKRVSKPSAEKGKKKGGDVTTEKDLEKEKAKKIAALKERYTVFMKGFQEAFASENAIKEIKTLRLIGYAEALKDLANDELIEEATNVKKTWISKVSMALGIVSSTASMKEFYFKRGLDKEANDSENKLKGEFAKLAKIISEPELVVKEENPKKKTDDKKKSKRRVRS